jgi:hypothetical protein
MAAFALARVEEPPEMFLPDYDVAPPRIDEQEQDIAAFALWCEGCSARLVLEEEMEDAAK